MKIGTVRSELFHAERQTDVQTDGRHDETNSSSSQFCIRASKFESELSVK